jgi:hypothetical protein
MEQTMIINRGIWSPLMVVPTGYDSLTFGRIEIVISVDIDSQDASVGE